MTSGITKAQPDEARGTMGIRITSPTVRPRKPSRITLAGRRLPALLAGQQRHAEHGQRQRRQRQAGLHRVVLQHHLQVDRQDDHRAAQSDLLEQLPGDPEPEQLGPEQVGVEQGRLSLALAPPQPVDKPGQRGRAEQHERADCLTALLPDQDAENQAAHADRGQDRADRRPPARGPV